MTTSTDTRAKTAVLAIICISYFMVILDNSIIFTGLPRIEAAMEFSPTGLTWVQDAYTLVFGGLLLLGARAGDIVGRRRMFTLGLVLFGAASFFWSAPPRARDGSSPPAPSRASEQPSSPPPRWRCSPRASPTDASGPAPSRPTARSPASAPASAS